MTPISVVSHLTVDPDRRDGESRRDHQRHAAKVEACIQALRAGVTKAHIIDGRIPHALLLEIYTEPASARRSCCERLHRHRRPLARRPSAHAGRREKAEKTAERDRKERSGAGRKSSRDDL
jgi:hypothetical protein